MSTIETTTVVRQRASVHPSLRAAEGVTKRGISLGERVVRDLAKAGYLPFRFSLPDHDAVIFARFLRDKEAAWGGSGALKPIDPGMIAVGGAERLEQPAIPTDAMLAVETVVRNLHRKEIELLAWLEDARTRIGVTLATLGRERYGLAEERQAYNQANGALRELAKAIAEHYPKARLQHWSGSRLKRDRQPAEP